MRPSTFPLVTPPEGLRLAHSPGPITGAIWAPALPLAPIHPNAWKGYSPKFVGTEFSEVSPGLR